MNIRRQPFQFTTIDPAKRQAELQKRFGLPSNDMYVDCVNPGIMGTGIREPSSVGSSPRLQHRVPMFTQGFEPTKSSNHQNNVDTGHKPRVRVIPIQVEGVNGTNRHRTFSGPAGSVNDTFQTNHQVPETFQNVESLNSVQVNGEMKNPNQSKVCSIPIKIEHKEEKDTSGIPSNKRKLQAQKPKSAKTNGCATSKVEEKPVQLNANITLKQIENVLNKLKTYHEEVEKFTGGPKDKQYRYLDEMLTRCMLDLDDIETLGMDNIRQARKAAVKKVQGSVDLLESKINMQSSIKEQISAGQKAVETVELADIPSQDNTKSLPAAAVQFDSNTMETSEPVIQNAEVEMSDIIEQTCTNETALSAEQNQNTLLEITDCTVNNDFEVNSSEPNKQSSSDVEMYDCLEGAKSEIEDQSSEKELDTEISSEPLNTELSDGCEVAPSEPLVIEPPDGCEIAPSEPLVTELPDISEFGSNKPSELITNTVQTQSPITVVNSKCKTFTNSVGDIQEVSVAAPVEPSAIGDS